MTKEQLILHNRHSIGNDWNVMSSGNEPLLWTRWNLHDPLTDDYCIEEHTAEDM